MHRDPDPLPGSEPAGVAFTPVGARGTIVEEMRVDVDEHPALPLLLLGLSRQTTERGLLLVMYG
jgi:hypothetical protein